MNEVFFFRVDSDDPIRLWSGHGDFLVPASTFEPAGAIYQGMGQLAQLPALQQLINGIAQRVEFTVSGVTTEIIQTALEDRETVRERQVLIGSIVLNSDQQPVGGVNLEWKGVADVLRWNSVSTEQGFVRSLTLSVRAGDVSRSRPRPTFFTDADQRRKSATDAFFSHIGAITQGVTRRFGPS